MTPSPSDFYSLASAFGAGVAVALISAPLRWWLFRKPIGVDEAPVWFVIAGTSAILFPKYGLSVVALACATAAGMYLTKFAVKRIIDTKGTS